MFHFNLNISTWSW